MDCTFVTWIIGGARGPIHGGNRHQSKARARDSVGARVDDVGKGGPLWSPGAGGCERVAPQMSQGNRTRATIGTYPSCLALIRPANAAAQLVLRTQAGRKEQRCCAASASHSGKAKGARPSPPLLTSLAPTETCPRKDADQTEV